MSNKQKHIDSAQKNIKKKLFSRAIKDYQKVLELDPRDIRSRQRLAELYVRTNSTGEAFEQYEAVAKYFSTNGFYLKAIAIYKQMQRLDPSQINIFSRLAELNEKQGLLGNALAELRHLVSYFEKNEMVADAIKTLEKMRDLDSGSINVQVKLAEVYAKNDRLEDGLTEFKDVLRQLEEKQDYEKILRLYRMFLPLFPQHDDLQKGLALTLLEMGEYSKGITILQQVLRKNPSDTEVLLTLGSTYQTLADFKNARLTYIHLLKLDSLDLEARENLVQCYLKEENYTKALVELEDWKEAFLKINRLERLQEFYEILLTALPGNLQVLQTLDSIYEITGDGDKLLDMVSGSDEAGAFNSMRIDIVEETLSDSLLGDMNVGDDSLTFDTSDLLGESMLIDLPADEDELELEPLEEEEDAEEEEEFIELNLNDAPEIDKSDSFDEMDLDFVLDEDPEVSAVDAGAELEEAEFYLQQGLFDEAEKVCTDILERLPDSAEAAVKLQEIVLRRDASDEPADPGQDLATELLHESFPEVEREDDVASAEAQFETFPDESPAVEVGGARKVFRTDVDEQIAADDMESHYNLGIAYREMGLFSDAIAEFTKAEKDQIRFVDCQTLKGLCWVDQGDFEKGESSYRAALEGESLAVGQRLSLYYELGALYENWQRPLDALECFKQVADSDLFFRDVADRLDRLRNSGDLREETDATQTSPAEPKDRISFL